MCEFYPLLSSLGCYRAFRVINEVVFIFSLFLGSLSAQWSIEIGGEFVSSLKKTDCGVDGEDEVGLILVWLFCFLLDIVSDHFRSDFNISQQCSY